MNPTPKTRKAKNWVSKSPSKGRLWGPQPQQNHTKSPCTSRGQGMIWVKQSKYQTNVHYQITKPLVLQIPRDPKPTPTPKPLAEGVWSMRDIWIYSCWNWLPSSLSRHSALRWQSRQRWAKPLAAVVPRLMDCNWRFTRPSWNSLLENGRKREGLRKEPMNKGHLKYLDPPRVSKFSPQVCFWWLTGSNLQTLARFYKFSCFRSCK